MSFEFIMKLNVIRKKLVMKKLMPRHEGRSFLFLYAALILLFSGL
jgi:hypothetical protein